MSFQFVMIMAIVIATVSGHFSRFRLSFLGLFSIATLLFMEASNAFMSAQSITWYQIAPQLHTIRSVTAGAIMSAVCNGFIVIALGISDVKAETPAVSGKAETPAVSDKAETA